MTLPANHAAAPERHGVGKEGGLAPNDREEDGDHSEAAENDQQGRDCLGDPTRQDHGSKRAQERRRIRPARPKSDRTFHADERAEKTGHH